MSPRDEIQSAMERLLAGAAVHTDGRLTRTNLALEAGVGRATLYRQHDLLAEFVKRIAEPDIAEPRNSQSVIITRLTKLLAKERTRRRESDRIANGLALVVAELYRRLDTDSVADPDRRIIPINSKSH